MSLHALLGAEEYITKAEVTRLTRFDRKTVDRLIRAGEIREVKMPGGLRPKVARSSVVAMMERLRTQGQAG